MLWNAKNYLGDCFRRWKARLGTPKAITAMAHKLARILWHLLKYQEPYDAAVWAKAEEKTARKKSNASKKRRHPRLLTRLYLMNLHRWFLRRLHPYSSGNAL